MNTEESRIKTDRLCFSIQLIAFEHEDEGLQNTNGNYCELQLWSVSCVA